MMFISPQSRARFMRFILLCLLAGAASGCTVIGVGREASADGSVMVAHTDDSGGMGDPRLVRVPARDWPEGATRPVYLSIADYPRLIAPDRAPEYSATSPAHAALPWATPLGAIPQVRRAAALRRAAMGGRFLRHLKAAARPSCRGSNPALRA